jgi:autotransporter-associated beta strand protein
MTTTEYNHGWTRMNTDRRTHAFAIRVHPCPSVVKRFCSFVVVLLTHWAAAQTTFNFPDLSLNIPDGNASGVFDSRTVSTAQSNAFITDVNVSIELAGTSALNGDLYVLLQHQGHTAVLLNRVGRTGASPLGYGDPGMNIVLDDDAPDGDVHTYRAAIFGNNDTPLGESLTGTWMPDGRNLDPSSVLDTTERTASLSSFNGLPVDGTWRLFLADVSPGGTAQLKRWSLQITGTTNSAATLLFDHATVRAPTARTLSNPIILPSDLIADVAQSLALSNVVSGSGGIRKSGNGDLFLRSANVFSGLTVVNAGRLIATNVTSNVGAGDILVHANGTLVARGTVGGALALHGTLSVGESIDTLSTAGQTWNGGGRYLWKINDAATPNGADLLLVNGTLNIDATFQNRFVIDVIAPTLPAHFDPGAVYAWPIALTTGGIVGFDPAAFRYEQTNFNVLSLGRFAVGLSSNNLDLVLRYGFPPLVTVQPLSRTNTAGANTTFVVRVQGTSPFFYQWRLNGTNIAGATNGTFIRLNSQQAAAGPYSVVVANEFGSTVSTDAVLAVTDASPAITVQPANKTTGAGVQVSFSVTTTGTDPRHFQWLFNGQPISGATNASLILRNPQRADAGAYSVAVSNALGSVLSSNALLSVTDDAPEILAQPTSRTVNAGANTSFSLVSSGTDPRSYQWFFNNVPITSGTNATLSIRNAQQTNAGLYSVTVTAPLGSVTSSNALLTVVDTAPIITAAPTNLTLSAGATLRLALTTQGTDPRFYQWTFNGDNIPGATNNVFTRANVQGVDGGLYAVVVSNALGSATAEASLTIADAPPTITTQPQSRTNLATTSATFSVKAAGTTPLGYQWRFNGADIPNATNASYIRPDVHSPDSGNYSVTVNNAFGSATSSNAILTIDNRFVALAGSYNGLFYETNGVRHESSGFINLTVKESGAFSGKLLCDGDTLSFSSQFNLLGEAHPTLGRTNKSLLTLHLQVDTTNGSDTVTGRVSDGVWTAEFNGDRAIFNATNTAPLGGLYTLTIPGSTNSPAPAGHGYALITLSSNGSIKLAGALADGAPLSQIVPVSRDGQWPVYMPLYAGRGSLLGWLHVDDSPSRLLGGSLSWIKMAGVPNSPYPAGFTNLVEAIGGPYAPPPPEVRLLDFTNAIVILSGGNLPGPFTNTITLKTNNLVKVTGPNPMSLKLLFTTASGFLSGSFVHPPGVTNAIKGAVLQGANRAAGFFLEADQSGAVIILPQPN